MDGLRDSGLCGDIGEPPAAFVLKQFVGFAFAGDIQIDASVVVEVAPCGAFHIAQIRQARRRRDVCEGAVVVVVKQLRGMRFFAARFMTDEKIPTIVIVIAPGGGLCGMEREQAGLFGDVFKTLAIDVAQQRRRILAVLAPPAAAQHQHVRTPVVVEVRVNHVQSAGDAGEPRGCGPVFKCAIAFVVKIAQRILRTGRRHDQVEESVAIEILSN